MSRCAGSREMRRSLVKSYSYSERDYAFGQLMLSLRMRISLTQAGLAALLHVQRRAVAGWEAGSSYPKAEHLKELIILAVQQQAFAAGREEEEIRALWKAAHQKVLLDEAWLHDLLGASMAERIGEHAGNYHHPLTLVKGKKAATSLPVRFQNLP